MIGGVIRTIIDLAALAYAMDLALAYASRMDVGILVILIAVGSQPFAIYMRWVLRIKGSIMIGGVIRTFIDLLALGYAIDLGEGVLVILIAIGSQPFAIYMRWVSILIGFLHALVKESENALVKELENEFKRNTKRKLS